MLAERQQLCWPWPWGRTYPRVADPNEIKHNRRRSAETGAHPQMAGRNQETGGPRAQQWVEFASLEIAKLQDGLTDLANIRAPRDP